MNDGHSSETIIWQEAAAGVWRANIGERDEPTLLNAAGARPQQEALREMRTAAFPIDTEEIAHRLYKGKTHLRFPLGSEESIYGFGLQFDRVVRNPGVLHLHLDAWGGIPGRTHAPVPFFVSSKGYAVLINSSRYLDFYIGTGVRTGSKNPPSIYDRNTDGDEWQAIPLADNIEVLIPAAGVEVFIFAGPTPLESVQRYNLYCGGGCLPPKWGLGFVQRVPTLYTQHEALREVDEFRERGFPLDVIGLEPGWHDYSYPCSYEWDKERFPNPQELSEELLSRGVRANLWMNPYIAPGTPLYEKLKLFAGSHTVWNGIVPDYTIAEAREAFSTHLEKRILSLGSSMSGFKIDEVDGEDHYLWPDVASFPSGLEAEQLRQTYGLLLQKLSLDLFHEHNLRTYGLVRGSNAGSAPMPFAIYSDSYNFEEYLTALCNSGFSGVLWTPEVRSAETAEEWVRRIQLVCFSPLAMLNAWSDGTKPWTFDEASDAVRDIMLLRIRLSPYIYSTFAQYHFYGTPPIRPMALLDGFVSGNYGNAAELDSTHNPYALQNIQDIKDQFMLGNSLLVAPLPPGKKSRNVILPGGRWFDFYNGEFVGDGIEIEASPPLNRVPLYVMDGGVIPMIPAQLHIPGKEEIVPLEVFHYGETSGTFKLYDDDGVTFQYEQGDYSWTNLEASLGASQNWEGKRTLLGPSGNFRYEPVTWRFSKGIMRSD